MKKKGIKMIAAAMSLVMLLTGCSSGAENGLFINDYLARNSAASDQTPESTLTDQTSSLPESKPEKVQIDKEALSIYTSSPVTLAVEEPFTLLGRE